MSSSIGNESKMNISAVKSSGAPVKREGFNTKPFYVFVKNVIDESKIYHPERTCKDVLWIATTRWRSMETDAKKKFIENVNFFEEGLLENSRLDTNNNITRCSEGTLFSKPKLSGFYAFYNAKKPELIKKFPDLPNSQILKKGRELYRDSIRELTREGKKRNFTFEKKNDSVSD